MEIERKFLTKEVPFSLADFPARKISPVLYQHVPHHPSAAVG